MSSQISTTRDEDLKKQNNTQKRVSKGLKTSKPGIQTTTQDVGIHQTVVTQLATMNISVVIEFPGGMQA